MKTRQAEVKLKWIGKTQNVAAQRPGGLNKLENKIQGPLLFRCGRRDGRQRAAGDETVNKR